MVTRKCMPKLGRHGLSVATSICSANEPDPPSQTVDSGSVPGAQLYISKSLATFDDATFRKMRSTQSR